MTSIIEPKVAGMFYPDDPEELRATVRTYLSQANAQHPFPKAIISPHAGFQYSGPIAAESYACLQNDKKRFDHVILLGPSHRYPFEGVAVTSADALKTPLGNIPIDHTLIDEIISLPQVSLVDQAFNTQENSLETQLPFLQSVIDNFSIVPLLIGDVNYTEVAAVLSMLWNGENTLIVVSSDLSHYLDDQSAKTIDTETVNAILALDPDKISFDQACGRTGIQALLSIAKEKGLTPGLLDLRNSGDTAGPKDQVVGYAAVHFYEG